MQNHTFLNRLKICHHYEGIDKERHGSHAERPDKMLAQLLQWISFYLSRPQVSGLLSSMKHGVISSLKWWITCIRIKQRSAGNHNLTDSLRG